MHQYVIVAILLVIVIVLIYRLCIHNSDRARRRRAEKLYQTSSGAFDDRARQALNELNQMKELRPEDRFRRATLVEYNILEGDLHQPFDGRDQMLRGITADFVQALHGIRNREWHPDAPEFIFHRIREFQDELDFDVELGMVLGEVLDETEPITRAATIAERQERAKSEAETVEDAMTGYLDEAIVFTSDAQNVHDSKVNEGLREIHAVLAREDYYPVTTAFSEAEHYILTEYVGDAEKRQNAIRTLHMMRTGLRISTFNDTEDHIFAMVWSRTRHPLNKKNVVLIKEAIANALADCIEHGNMVCINGRCGRILNSLTMLDCDPVIAGGVMTYEAYRAQIFTETQNIIKARVDDYAESDDPAKKKLAESYRGSGSSPDPEVEERFKQEVCAAIDQNIETYFGKMSPAELERIRIECHAALD